MQQLNSSIGMGLTVVAEFKDKSDYYFLSLRKVRMTWFLLYI